MRKNDNWAYLPDYSHPNHTLRTPRTSRAYGKYVAPPASSEIGWSIIGVIGGALAIALACFL